ncbi:MAG: O-antigen ligase family protein [Candidatus Kerfeldbacteria bacterium]|nr:O-antigen ligase family protein [Candidatus Kerfeldbacteria bacterium]
MRLMPLKAHGSMFNAWFEWLVTLPALLTPIFFLPFTPDALGFNKTLLLLVFVLAAGVVWFARLVRERQLAWVSTPFGRLLGLFVLVAVLAWLFSPYRYTGLVGAVGFENHPLALLLIAAFYAVLVSQLSSPTALHRLLRFLVLGSGLVFLYALAKLFGLELLPWDRTSSGVFLLATNSSGVLGLMAAASLTLSLGFLRRETGAWRWTLIVVSVLAFVLLAILDHRIGWIGAMIGLGLLLLARLLRSDAASTLATAGLSFLIALIFVLYLVPIGRFTSVTPPADLVLDSRTSRAITADVLRQDPVFGRGPESFLYAFATERPPAYNDGPLWNIRFLKASNEFHQLLVGTGIVGTVTFFAFVLMLAGFVIHRLLHESHEEERLWSGAATAAWLAVAASLFFFPWSMMTTFLFFALAGVLMGQARFALDSRPVRLDGHRRSLALVGFSLFIIVAVTGVFMGGRFWLAEWKYQRSLDGISQTEDIEQVRNRLVSAISLHPWEAKYYFTLAQTDLVRAQLALQKEEPDQAAAQNAFATALAAVQGAARVEPQYPDTYEQLANFYILAQNISGSDFLDAAIASYGLAANIEPQNPLHYVSAGRLELGRAGLLATQSEQTESEEDRTAATEQRDQALERANAFFDEALERKRAFPSASLGKALVLELQGDVEAAVAALQAILSTSPNDEQTWIDLGRIENNRDNVDAALTAFTQAALVNPANTGTFLTIAQLQEEKGDTAAALAAYQKVNALAPGDAGVEAKIEKLQASE